MAERRVLRRMHLIFYLKVYEEDKSSLLGQLVDISSQGLKVLSAKLIEVGKVHSMVIELPQATTKREYIHLEAECVWSNPDINPGIYVTGFKIVTPTKMDGKNLDDAIEGLFKEYLFEEEAVST